MSLRRRAEVGRPAGRLPGFPAGKDETERRASRSRRLSPECGFSSTVEGNLLTADEQSEKLRLVVETGEEV